MVERSNFLGHEDPGDMWFDSTMPDHAVLPDW